MASNQGVGGSSPSERTIFILYNQQVNKCIPGFSERYVAELYQRYLADNPRVGDVIQDTGGLRKIRWSANGKGKRGGVRVIYYHLTADAQIRLLLIYKKVIQDNLT